MKPETEESRKSSTRRAMPCGCFGYTGKRINMRFYLRNTGAVICFR